MHHGIYFSPHKFFVHILFILNFDIFFNRFYKLNSFCIMKSTLFYSNMRMTVKLSIFIWLLALKSVNGFGYVNQTEVKSQYKGCLNICVKLCKAFGETRLEFKPNIWTL